MILSHCSLLRFLVFAGVEWVSGTKSRQKKKPTEYQVRRSGRKWLVTAVRTRKTKNETRRQIIIIEKSRRDVFTRHEIGVSGGDPRGSGDADRSEAINRFTRRRRPGASASVRVCVRVYSHVARVTAFAFFRRAVRARCVYVPFGIC